MALAAVVSRVASTKRIKVAAYAAPTGATRQDQPLRASGTTSSSASAATPDRKLATCQGVRAAALMAAPPVENNTAAATSSNRLRRGEDRIPVAPRMTPIQARDFQTPGYSSKATRTNWLRVRTAVFMKSCCRADFTEASEMPRRCAISLLLN